MKPHEYVRLSKLIGKGRTHYVLKFGVCGWGLLTAVFVVIMRYFSRDTLTAQEILAPFVIFPIVGVFWGLVMWSFLLRRYRKLGLGISERN